MKRLVILGALLAILLSGCSCIVGQYEARGIVEPPASSPPVTVAQAAFPWQAIADFLGEVLPTLGQTRRKAMEEKVGYTEERKFTLFHIEK